MSLAALQDALGPGMAAWQLGSDIWLDRSLCESPLEWDFGWELKRYLHPENLFTQQLEVQTFAGRFRLDFAVIVKKDVRLQGWVPEPEPEVISGAELIRRSAERLEARIARAKANKSGQASESYKPGDLLVGFECDGREFHDTYRDDWRDAVIVGEGKANVIYRFLGKDIYHSVVDCLYLLSKLEPTLFSQGGRRILGTQANDATRDWPEPEHESIAWYYVNEEDRDGTKGHYDDDGNWRHEGKIYRLMIREMDGLIRYGKRALWQVYHKFALQTGRRNLDEIIASWKSSHGTDTPHKT